MTFAFIRDPETRLACQRLLLLDDLRLARLEHRETARIRCAIKQATRRLLEYGQERMAAG